MMNGVEAHISVTTNVGVKNLGDEANLGGTHGIAAHRTQSLSKPRMCMHDLTQTRQK